MGSLMAGWNSPVLDPKYAKYLRSISFTKGEIEAYWRLKKKTEEEHLKTTLSGDLQDTRTQENGQMESGIQKLQQSNSLPPANIRESPPNEDSETDLKIRIWKNALWTSSIWAFLNQPPVIVTEAPSHKYASQYHSTNFSCSSKTDTDPLEMNCMSHSERVDKM